MELIIKSLEELPKVAAKLIAFAGKRRKWCFYGDLGAGKTTIIKAIGAYLNIQESVTSPTYSLVNEYTYQQSENSELQYLYHMDLYRLKSIEEALDIGIEEYLYNEDYCFIEWAETIEQILPEEVLKINIELIADNERKVTVD